MGLHSRAGGRSANGAIKPSRLGGTRSFGRILPIVERGSLLVRFTIHCDVPMRMSPRDAPPNRDQPLLFGSMPFRVHHISEIISHE